MLRSSYLDSRLYVTREAQHQWTSGLGFLLRQSTDELRSTHTARNNVLRHRASRNIGVLLSYCVPAHAHSGSFQGSAQYSLARFRSCTDAPSLRPLRHCQYYSI